jgi:hypothetical protein
MQTMHSLCCPPTTIRPALLGCSSTTLICLTLMLLPTAARACCCPQQVYVYEGDDADYAQFLQALHCMVCGGDENEEHLLICDGEHKALVHRGHLLLLRVSSFSWVTHIPLCVRDEVVTINKHSRVM